MSADFDLEREVRDLAARRDIGELTARYARGLDRLDRDLVRSAFHDDAWIDAGMFQGGPEEFTAFCIDFLGSTGGSQHLLGQNLITVQGQSARGELYFQAWHAAKGADDAPSDLFIAGRYVDEYESRGGEWRIFKRKLITDWASNHAADAFLAGNTTSNRGGRRGADFSEILDWPR